MKFNLTFPNIYIWPHFTNDSCPTELQAWSLMLFYLRWAPFLPQCIPPFFSITHTWTYCCFVSDSLYLNCPYVYQFICSSLLLAFYYLNFGSSQSIYLTSSFSMDLFLINSQYLQTSGNWMDYLGIEVLADSYFLSLLWYYFVFWLFSWGWEVSYYWETCCQFVTAS